MEQIIKLLTVFGFGAVELWAAIPIGRILGFGPFVTAATAASGGVLGSLVILAVGERIRIKLLEKVKDKHKRSGYIDRMLDRHGAAGLGLLSPFLIGAPLGTALGIAMGVPGSRLFFWMSLGIIICTIGLTIIAELGIVSIESLMYS